MSMAYTQGCLRTKEKMILTWLITTLYIVRSLESDCRAWTWESVWTCITSLHNIQHAIINKCNTCVHLVLHYYHNKLDFTVWRDNWILFKVGKQGYIHAESCLYKFRMYKFLYIFTNSACVFRVNVAVLKCHLQVQIFFMYSASVNQLKEINISTIETMITTTTIDTNNTLT